MSISNREVMCLDSLVEPGAVAFMSADTLAEFRRRQAQYDEANGFLPPVYPDSHPMAFARLVPVRVDYRVESMQVQTPAGLIDLDVLLKASNEGWPPHG